MVDRREDTRVGRQHEQGVAGGTSLGSLEKAYNGGEDKGLGARFQL